MSNSKIMTNILRFFFPEYITNKSATYSDQSRAKKIYGEAFKKVFEYIFDGAGLEESVILEFGTYYGYTAKTIANLMKEFNSQAHLYLFDSFEGFPETRSSIDLNCYEIKQWSKGQANVPTNTEFLIKKALLKLISSSQLTIVKGKH